MLILPHSEFSPPGPIVISRREKALNLNLEFCLLDWRIREARKVNMLVLD